MKLNPPLIRSRIVSTALRVVIPALILLMCYVAYTGLRSVSLIASGTSMLPTLGQWGINTHDTSGVVGLGSIVVIRLPEALAQHRVVALRGDYVVTQGDNNAYPDGRIEGTTFVVYESHRDNIITVVDPESVVSLRWSSPGRNMLPRGLTSATIRKIEPLP